jgi:hypothetical protein
MRYEFIYNGVLNVIRLGTTLNDKIAPSDLKMIQTYHYSRAQYEEGQGKTTMNKFFGLDSDVCMDCVYAMGNGASLKGCYTHKRDQYSGMLSQLRSIGRIYGDWDNIPVFNEDIQRAIVKMCMDKYVRFGTYGEPVLLPIDLVERVCFVAKSWTGYTHQWRRVPYYDYREFFMASTQGLDESLQAETMGWRVFMDDIDKQRRTHMIGCPASEENGYKSDCAKCSLCSGTKGKGNKSVYIFNHS